MLKLRLFGIVVLSLLLASCDSGAAYSANGSSGAYGSVDLTRLASDKPPPASHRDNDRYFNGNLGP